MSFASKCELKTNKVLKPNVANRTVTRVLSPIAERRLPRGPNENAEELEVPNCFVCRGDPENIVPRALASLNMLKAIPPEVRKKARLEGYANRRLLALICVE